MEHFSNQIHVNSPAFFVALSTSRFQRFPDQNDDRGGTPQVDRKLRSKYTTSLFCMAWQSIRYTRDLHIGNVMKHISINLDNSSCWKSLIESTFLTVIPTYYMSMQRNLSAVIAGRLNLIHDFHFIVMLAANRNIRFTWRNSGCIFKLNVSEGK